MFGSILIIVVILLPNVMTLLEDPIMLSDLNGLSELPLDKLLRMRSTMEREIEGDDELVYDEVISASLDNSGAQALHGKMKKPYQRGSYETSWQKKGGKKGLSTIFQISITALAFLAFGGYLLCLLVQAIKSKQTTTTTTTANGGMVVVTSPLRRRRPGYRHRRQVTWPETDPETLYYALKMFSEGYTTYHTVDYKYFNFTVDSLG